MDKQTLLKKYWGYDTFRPLQEEIIDSVLAGRDTLALLPTGGGKSLCYQLPALMTEGLCLVVSPLIALMKDQVQRLNERGIKAACIVSGMSHTDATAVLTNCLSGTVKLLYVSPERLRQHLFIEHFRRMKVALIAVDEAHCVSQWGYDFRPPYLQIADIRQYHPTVPLLALTATATPEVADDIRLHLLMRNCRTFTASYVRPNLRYSVVRGDDRTGLLLRVVKQGDGCGIVYARSRRATQQIADLLNASGISATYYHAGLDAAERDRRQALWMSGKCRVMVATNAFGMGIDKPDVRFVLHVDMPDSLEAYFQEAGRAGRDGLPADAIALFSHAEHDRMERDYASLFPPIKYIRSVYMALCNFYRIPLGSGADSHFDFDLEVLCSTYRFSVREFYNACRFLERLGLIALPEREEAYSTLYIPVGRDELYRFQLDHLRLGSLLETLMRMYPGLLVAPVPVDERKIASRGRFETVDVISMLGELHAMHVVEYRPRPQKPQIIFVSERIDEREIPFGNTHYDQLKEAARRRLEAVYAYVDNDGECRMRQLAAYLGETEGVTDCGVCDVCRRAAGDKGSVEEAVTQLLKHGAMTPQELCRLLENDGWHDVAAVVRRMLDAGSLYLSENMQLSLS
jgi:ATP-dependent DNA helicase RecQ